MLRCNVTIVPLCLLVRFRFLVYQFSFSARNVLIRAFGIEKDAPFGVDT